MAFSVVMPALEMAQETGKLIAWRKQEGDRVTKGEPLLEIETDKAVMEVESPAEASSPELPARSEAIFKSERRLPGSWLPAKSLLRKTNLPPGRPRPEPVPMGELNHTRPSQRRHLRRLRRFGAQEYRRKPAVSPKNWVSILPPCAALGRAERSSHRMCKRRPLTFLLCHPLQREQATSKFPARLAA